MELKALYPDQKTYRLALIDEYIEAGNFFQPFAVADALMKALNSGQADFDLALHFWPTDPTVYLGMMDARLPYLADGLQLIRQTGYQPTIRSAGGLAVVSDPGILNFTLIVKPAKDRLLIDQAYQVMTQVLDQVFAPYGFKVISQEVPQSYCPGSFDLSLAGKKIAGQAQRRIGQAVGIFVYLSIEGNQDQRAQLIHDFYLAAKKGEETKHHYPDVDPAVMRTVDSVIPDLGQLASIKQAIIASISQALDIHVIQLASSDLDYQTEYERIKSRNQDFLTQNK
ncbi:hypothetical protein AWM75_03965 [Aerococcus urinaehominis]|uniref:Uncharacterized protein n=1 Tax=Aerococcus urinaehominis TaxID=128944 RepID=A0A0X8FKX8_9LACT|nr:hypothetical protein [Aerococcus urinaehominis]AMB99212.1 hypothetical protein AWM75_03965 [Aerococcus urinaehominis]SDM32215.1 octanoyl-[GcvH]:protein N-octanoyltransferase [Aerococcus urinaehominis]